VQLADRFINRLLEASIFRATHGPQQTPLELNMRRIILNWLAALGTASLLAACGGGGSDTATNTPSADNSTVAQTMSDQQDLSALKAAVQYVDEGSDDKLMPALQAAGDMTFFAPSNAAFDKLAQEMIGPGKKAADLLTPEYKDDVRDIIKNHMLVGKAIKSSMSMNSSASTYLDVSATITITIANGVLTIFTGNGIVHIIDCILMPPKPMLGKSIVAVAAKTPSLSSLVAALKFASNDGDLVKLLSKRGTYTVFAPTNDAFDALAVELLGAGKTATDLLVPANKALVRAVLQYHVLGAVVPKAAIPLGKPIDPLLEGKDFFKIDAVDGKVIITDGRNRKSEITATDIKAKNGVVHLINKVILPADKDIVQTAIASAPEFSILVEAVVAAGLTETLSKPGPYTVFAPTNDAFAKLLTELKISKDDLLKDKALLTKVLTYHVVSGLVLKADVPVGVDVKTVQGDTFSVNAHLQITDQAARKSSIVATDVLTKNGVIHVIDKVILPKLN
jgi:uncharacterized surface protein with fasciclin (FAS1) repeats